MLFVVMVMFVVVGFGSMVVPFVSVVGLAVLAINKCGFRLQRYMYGGCNRIAMCGRTRQRSGKKAGRSP